MMSKRVVVIGTGYVGLPAAILLARAGYKVVGVDIDEKKVEAINTNTLNIEEDELNQIFQEKEVRDNIIATNAPTPGDVFIIAVPTPLDRRKKIADLSHVQSAVSSIIPHLEKGNLIVIESTIPPLTCRKTIKPMIEENTDLAVNEDVHIAHCPERILPGNVFHEIIHNDRIIGGMDQKAAEMAVELYSSFVKGNLYVTDDVTAELTKLVENTYRDINIAFANEIDQVCKNLDIKSGEVIDLANRHPRVNMLKPGIGVGGHCIPIDPWFIKEVDPENATLIFTARKINDDRPEEIARRIRMLVSDVDNPQLVAVGLTYKPNTYDTRESPSQRIIDILDTEGYDIVAYDPHVDNRRFRSLADIAAGKDCLLILVEHDEVLEDLSENEDAIKSRMRTPIIYRPSHPAE